MYMSEKDGLKQLHSSSWQLHHAARVLQDSCLAARLRGSTKLHAKTKQLLMHAFKQSCPQSRWLEAQAQSHVE
jgi:hypothetical protein